MAVVIEMCASWETKLVSGRERKFYWRSTQRNGTFMVVVGVRSARMAASTDLHGLARGNNYRDRVWNPLCRSC